MGGLGRREGGGEGEEENNEPAAKKSQLVRCFTNVTSIAWRADTQFLKVLLLLRAGRKFFRGRLSIT